MSERGLPVSVGVLIEFAAFELCALVSEYLLQRVSRDLAGLASWVANIRAAADEMATRIADMLVHMGGD